MEVIRLNEIRNPVISVIIPTYNEEKYLKYTLLSIKNQDFDLPYEIIIGDSKSEDRTIEIAKEFADKIAIIEKRNIGAGRNAGAKISKGKYLVFIDADTIAAPNLLSEFYNTFLNDNIVGVTCPIVPLPPTVSNLLMYTTFNYFCKFTIYKKPQLPGIICAYRRDAFFEVGGFNEELHVCEDFDLSERIAKLGKIVYNEKTFVMTSARRIEKWGKGKSAAKYIGIYISYLLRNRLKRIPFSYEPIR